MLELITGSLSSVESSQLTMFLDSTNITELLSQKSNNFARRHSGQKSIIDSERATLISC